MASIAPGAYAVALVASTVFLATDLAATEDLFGKLHTEAARNLHLSDLAFYQRFGSAFLDFVIVNDNPFPVKDLSIACDMRAPSGTTLAHALTVAYELVPAKVRKIVVRLRIEDVINPKTMQPIRLPDQAKSAACTIALSDKIIEIDGAPVRTEAQLRAWCARVHWTALCP